MIVHFRKRPDLFSRLICWATGEEYSHCGVQLGSVELIHESTFLGGCSVVSKEEFLKHPCESFSIEIFNAQYENINRALALKGNRYDVPNILFLALMMLLKRVGIKIDYRSLVINPSLFICSEYVNYVVFGDKTVITPGELLQKCVESKWSEK